MAQQSAQKSSTRPWILALLLFLFGGGFAGGGVYLLSLGGSTYYLVGGILVLLSAVQLWRGKPSALWLYVLFSAFTLFWAIYEAGFDGWSLAPRLLIPAGFGVWMALPWIKRWLYPNPGEGQVPSGARACLTLSVAAVVVILGAALKPLDEPAAFPSAVNFPVDAKLTGSEGGEWKHFGNTLAGTRFSPLTQINIDNVDQLKPAWIYRTGVVQEGETSPLQSVPLMVNNSLYLCTQTNIVISLDPETGEERWRYDPKVDPTGASVVTTCRGVAYSETPVSTVCPKRIIAATFDARLIAVNADTGGLCPDFGNNGQVDLKRGMGQVDAGFYYASSAPTIVRGNVILGGWIADNVQVEPPSGVIRAFDAVTGTFSWAWDLGRPGYHAEPAPGEVYTRGTPNSWAPMSGDEELGMVYLPTGNATPDHWGGHRTKEMDEFSSSVVALDAETGELRWHYQTVHHDLWDYDVASQPTLIDVDIDGERVPALVQPTKQGQTFLLDRRNGKLLADVEERPVSHDAAPGDWMSPTQPFSTELPTFSTETLEEKDMWGITPFDQLWCRIHFKQLRYEGPFTPIGTEKMTLVYPGAGGGMNYGGVSVDPEHGVMLVNSLHVGTRIRLLPRDELGEGVDKEHKFHLDGPPMLGTPYALYWDTFISPLLIPCNEPPYGLMSAVDLNSRKLLWSVRLGTARDSGLFKTGLGVPIKMGMPNFGGSMTTRGGLVFIGASHERALRAFDIRTGKEVWKARLKAGAHATPMTYISPTSGRQFVVTIAGGHRTLQSPLGDYVQAFAIPESAN